MDDAGAPRIALLVASRAVGDLARHPGALIITALPLLAGTLALRLGFGRALIALLTMHPEGVAALLPTLLVALLLASTGIAAGVSALDDRPLCSALTALPGLFAAVALGFTAALGLLLTAVVGWSQLPSNPWLRSTAIALLATGTSLICATTTGAVLLACGRLAEHPASAVRLSDGVMATGRAFFDLLRSPLRSLAQGGTLALLGSPLLLLAVFTLLGGWLVRPRAAAIALHAAHSLALSAWLLLWILGLRRGIRAC